MEDIINNDRGYSGLASGMMIRPYSENGPHPSMMAASSISWGISLKNWVMITVEIGMLKLTYGPIRAIR